MAVLAMSEDTQVAVLEMGMNHFREIAYLASIAQPDVAVITNIGTMHIEHLGSQEGILQAKLEILEGMSDGSKVILNGDDPLLWNLQRRDQYAIRYCGVENAGSDYCGSDIRQNPGLLQFQVTYGTLSFPVELSLDGRHFVSDALLAIGVGVEMGMNPSKIQEALSQFRNMAGRQEIFEANGCTIIKDCYNAGPESMAAALAVLGSKPGRRVAVLGDMLELGVCTQAEHYRVGRIAAERADLLLAYGPNSSRVIGGAVTGGMPEARAKAFESRDEIVAAMKRMVKAGDVILVKGSRGMHMELILEQFLKDDK
jgi:UDP-N-acetylmuramoyl-tripeptide--D-alanyl-D-alanine ligase